MPATSQDPIAINRWLSGAVLTVENSYDLHFSRARTVGETVEMFGYIARNAPNWAEAFHTYPYFPFAHEVYVESKEVPRQPSCITEKLSS